MRNDLVNQKRSGWSILWGILLLIAGILAISAPVFAAVAVNVVIAWMIIFAGCLHFVYGFHAKRVGSVLWEILVAVVYIVTGIYMLMHPVLGIASLTLLLACLFLL